MIISIDAEKAFNKIQHPFMKKCSEQISIETPCLNKGMVMYDEPISY
jgi:hypothetical protein